MGYRRSDIQLAPGSHVRKTRHGQRSHSGHGPAALMRSLVLPEVTIERKQEDGKTKYERRYAQVVAPVFNDIIKGLNEFAKAKGYAVILDGAKLEQEGILMGFDDKYDVTKEFIAFYNARPAGTATNTAASATPPKNK